MAKNIARSIYSSQDKPIDCVIKGTIPKWVNGTLFRNGPGRFRFDNDRIYSHLFDGMSVVNKFKIVDGKVQYQNKLLETKTLEKNLNSTGLVPMFGTADPCSRLFDRYKIMFSKGENRMVNDNTNVNIVPFGNDQLYALTETSIINRLDPDTLNIMSVGNITKHVKPTLTTFAHPQIEDDGSWISVGMNPKGSPITYDILRYQAGQQVENAVESAKLITQIPSSHSLGLSYFHSIGLSQNYIIFLENALVFDLKRVLRNIITNQSFADALHMNRTFQTRIHLMDRKTGQLLPNKYVTDPQFMFHHINAYETNLDDPSKSELLVDICSYDAKTFEIRHFDYDENNETEPFEYFEKTRPFAKRIHVPLHNKDTVVNEPIYCELKDICSKATLELPVLNFGKYNAKPYNYVYGIGSVKAPISIVKINVNNQDDFIQAVLKSDTNKHLVPSEPVFVENPDATSEDDGVLLSLVLGEKHDMLLVLDAKTLEEIARAELPEEVKASFTLHGFFADTKGFEKLN